jgi:hypothetical protein
VKGYVQGLYERYSNLALSFDADRPVAIKGLEKRLIRTFKTKGGYGVFACYLYRCLLWQRSGDTLKRIKSFRGEQIPSWSWMAYTGGIEYMDVPYGQVMWTEDIQSPFMSDEHDVSENAKKTGKPFEITTQAWSMVGCCDDDLILDDADRILAGPRKCVILGTDKVKRLDQSQKHYVLIIITVPGEAADVFERVGVGTVEEGQIIRDVPVERARII